VCKVYCFVNNIKLLGVVNLKKHKLSFSRTQFNVEKKGRWRKENNFVFAPKHFTHTPSTYRGNTNSHFVISEQVVVFSTISHIFLSSFHLIYYNFLRLPKRWNEKNIEGKMKHKNFLCVYNTFEIIRARCGRRKYWEKKVFFAKKKSQEKQGKIQGFMGWNDVLLYVMLCVWCVSSVKEKYWLNVGRTRKNMKNVINSIIMMFPLHFAICIHVIQFFVMCCAVAHAEHEREHVKGE
jgi:hypothetical protein